MGQVLVIAGPSPVARRLLVTTGMRNTDSTEADPLVLEASMTDDLVKLGLTKQGYEALEEALEMLRETNPKATYEDVIAWMLSAMIEELEAEIAKMH